MLLLLRLLPFLAAPPPVLLILPPVHLFHRLVRLSAIRARVSSARHVLPDKERRHGGFRNGFSNGRRGGRAAWEREERFVKDG